LTGGSVLAGIKIGSELLDSLICLGLAVANWFCVIADLCSAAHLKWLDFLAGVLDCLVRASFLAIAFGARTTGGLIVYVAINLNCDVIE
jgi:hypothetical protein